MRLLKLVWARYWSRLGLFLCNLGTMCEAKAIGPRARRAKWRAMDAPSKRNIDLAIKAYWESRSYQKPGSLTAYIIDREILQLEKMKADLSRPTFHAR